MIITRDEQCCLPIVRVEGTFEEGDWPELQGALQALSAEGHLQMALDLSGVAQCAPTVGERLRQTRQALAQRFQSLALIGLSPSAIEALSLAAL